MTPAEVITRALNDLTQTLKGKSNKTELDQIEALKKLDNILNNKLETAPTLRESTIPDQRRVTFDKATKPPQ